MSNLGQHGNIPALITSSWKYQLNHEHTHDTSINSNIAANYSYNYQRMMLAAGLQQQQQQYNYACYATSGSIVNSSGLVNPSSINCGASGMMIDRSSINYCGGSRMMIDPISSINCTSASPSRLRSLRAPRMRWTSSLHAHFVHAVDLLGGHESNRYNC
jgi:hypothetical protein